jgi:hypothetical protein
MSLAKRNEKKEMKMKTLGFHLTLLESRKQEQMLEIIQGKRNPHALLVEI